MNFSKSSSPFAGISIYTAILAITFVATTSQADEMPTYQADEVVVTAGRSPALASELTRTVRVISRREIEIAPVSTLQDLLAYALGVDLQTRGPNGVQADLSIRGSSFEQTLVLVDGYRLSDPQTGHHQLNIPLPLSEVERVEVLFGHGSRLYGPSAMGGVVNVITRQGGGRSLAVAIEGGDYELVGAGVSLHQSTGAFDHALAVEQRSTGNYVPSSESKTLNANYRLGWTMGAHRLGLMAGHQDKEFGASTFYTNLFPFQWEHTKATLVGISDYYEAGNWRLTGRLSWRGHKDEFILDRNRPTFSHNEHETNCTTEDLQVGRITKLGLTTVGLEVGQESISSSNLGDHYRSRWGVSVEQRLNSLGRFDATVGLSGYGYTDWGFEVYPGIDAGYRLNDQWRIFATAGGSFRPPTFTELYYDTPANKGDPNLQPERIISYETGLRWSRGIWSVGGSYFHRSGEDVMDWARASSADPWRVMNIANIETDGGELTAAFRPNVGFMGNYLTSVKLGLTHISTSTDFQGLISKYALTYPTWQAALALEHRLSTTIGALWNVRYKERTGQPGYFVTDLSLFRSFGKFGFEVSATNLFDQTYEELAFVPMPGRWFKVGLTWQSAPASPNNSD